MITGRLFVFLGAFILFTFLESKFPRLPKKSSWKRNGMNLLFPMVTNLIIRLLIPFIVMFNSSIRFDLMSKLGIEGIWRVIFAVVVMDLMVYIQHVVTHKVPFFWRFHRMHHSDVEMDASTGVRFHPIELIASYFYKIALYTMFGLDMVGIFFFEILLNASAMFNHMNLRLPEKVDKYLSYIIVTPNMHLNHHQVERSYCDSNYGFFLSIWDRLFRTHTKHLEESKQVGISRFRSERDQSFDKLLVQPFN